MKELSKKLYLELLNPDFSVENMRTESLVKKEYIDILDPYFDTKFSAKNYPLNVLGPIIRINSSAHRYYINFEKLMKKRTFFEITSELDNNENKIKKINEQIGLAFEMLAQRSYEIEWNHHLTRDDYDINLNEMTNAYGLGNKKVSEIALTKYLDWKRNGKKENFSIMDIGVGTGNTIAPLIQLIANDIKKNGGDKGITDKLKIFLVDIDKNKCIQLRDKLISKFPMLKKSIEVICTNLESILEQSSSLKSKIDLIISGATFCHSTNKKKMFKDLHQLLNRNGTLAFWEGSVPIMSNYSIKLLPKDKNDRFLNKNGEKFISSDLAKRYAMFLASVYPNQIGLRSGLDYIDLKKNEKMTFSVEDEFSWGLKAYKYILESFNSESGFNFIKYIEWIHSSITALYEIPLESRSQYFLIESFEDQSIINFYLKEACFNVLKSDWIYNDLLFTKDSFLNAASAACILTVATPNSISLHTSEQ